MPQRPTVNLAAALAVMTGLSAVDLRASFIPIHGGPTYTVGAGGYRAPVLSYAPGSTAGKGVGVATATYRDAAGSDVGLRAVRWDAIGNAAELQATTGAATAAFAISDGGTVVGSATIGSLTEAIRWTPGSAAGTYLSNINAEHIGSSAAYAINVAGMMTGYAERYDASGQNRGPRAVRWSSIGLPTVLDPLGQDASGNAAAHGYAINAAGTVVGYGATAIDAPSERAIRWDAGSTIATELGTLARAADGSGSAYAVAINDTGTAIGYSNKYNASGDGFIGNRAVRWQAGSTEAIELASLGADVQGSSDSIANAINAAGTIVGSSTKYDAAGYFVGTRATRWNAGEADVIELPGLGGVTVRSEAYAINVDGNAVGFVDFETLAGAAGTRHAVVWNEGGDVRDLNALIDPESGWTLATAVGINDAGWITGVGRFDPDGLGPIDAYDRLFLIQLPEPTTGGALAAAMLAIALRRRTPPVPSPGMPGEG